jgi:hypothetical protein
VKKGGKTYSGGLDEDIEGIFPIYKTLAKTCKLSEEEITLCLPMILDGEAMALY